MATGWSGFDTVVVKQYPFVSEVSAGADERVGRMVNVTSLASGSVAGFGAYGAGRSVGQRLV